MGASEVTSETKEWSEGGGGCATLMGASEVTSETKKWSEGGAVRL